MCSTFVVFENVISHPAPLQSPVDYTSQMVSSLNQSCLEVETAFQGSCQFFLTAFSVLLVLSLLIPSFTL